MPGTGAGARRFRIEFERATPVRGALGVRSPSGTWASLGHARAKVLYGPGSERREAGVQGAAQVATFRCLLGSVTRGVTEKDRIAHAGLAWNITGIARIDVHPAEVEFTAVAVRG